MMQLGHDEIIKKLIEKTGKSQAELEARIKEKMDQLAGLISKDGAAHIVANELSVNLFEDVTSKVKINKIIAGMRNLEIVGKVQAKYEIREFTGTKGAGRVGSFLLADDTGITRIVCWHDQTDKMAQINEGDILRIKNGYAKENLGRKEIHLNQSSEIEINPAGETVTVSQNIQAERAKAGRKKIAELNETDDNIEILGTVVQAFEPHYFAVCPRCGKRARQREDKFTCDQHGEIAPDYSYVMNAVIDDGTETIRAVFFRDQAETLLGKPKEEMLQYRDFKEKFDQVKIELLGQIVKLTGRVTKNAMFDRMEFVTRAVEMNPNPDDEIARLNNDIKKNA